MAKSHLALPVQLDVLRLEHEIKVAGPLLDFTKLPWANSRAHKDSPYLGETITEEAFEDQHPLQPGLHFHWSLPPALTKTSSIGIVYRQTFQSVFGKEAQANGEKSGDDIWDELLGAGWLKLIDQRIGMALANLPAEEEQAAWLQGHLPQYAHAVRKLLRTSVFPPTPNRWLLSRIVDEQPQAIKVIESDYLWPVGHDAAGDGPMPDRYTVYPQLTTHPDQQPFRYLGRAYDLGSEPPPASPSDYLDTPLTAVGYGETAFAAFYPICRSVFGYHDPQLPASAEEHYELIGWYDNPAQDYFRLFVDTFKATWQSAHQTDDVVGTHQQHQQVNYLYLDLLDAILRQLRIEVPVKAPEAALQAVGPDQGVAPAKDEPQNAWEYLHKHRWLDADGQLLPKAYSMTAVVGAPFQSRSQDVRQILNAAIEAQMPERLICYARVDRHVNDSALPEVVGNKIKLALGNSPTEALSALLAAEISAAKKNVIEDQLEAIQFAAELEHTTVDTGPIFAALRHEKQFHAVAAGQSWRIITHKEAGQTADQVAADEQVTLPEGLANALNRLNRLEEEKERNNAAIGSLRRQIYADWCWYLKEESRYKSLSVPDFTWQPAGPEFGTQVGEPHAGEPHPARPSGPAFGAGVGTTRPLAQSTQGRAEPYMEAEAALLGGYKAFITDAIDSRLAELLGREAQINGRITDQFAATQDALLDYQRLNPRPALELAPVSAARFWRPNDPVVMVSGFQPSTRYQPMHQSLPTRLVPFDGDLHSTRPEQPGVFQTLLQTVWKNEKGEIDVIGAPPAEWQPVFLAWDTSFSQAHQQQDDTYDPAYLQDHYRLGNTDFEAAAQPFTYDSPVPLYGRTVLTPGASLYLKKTIINRLTPVLYRSFVDETAGSTAGPLTIALFNEKMSQLGVAAKDLPIDDPDLDDEMEIKRWLADELDQQSDTDGKLAQRLLAYLTQGSRQPIIRQYLDEKGRADLSGNIDDFLDWAEARSHIKASYVAQLQKPLEELLDIALVDQDDVRQAFVGYLKTTLGRSLERYHTEMATPAEAQADYLNDHFNDLISWYQPQVSEALHLVVEIRAYQALLSIGGLAQAMTGFGEALIMRHQAFQLPVYNPFPYDGDQVFTAKVRQAVQMANEVAPNEYLPFSPWRAGKIALSELELMDTFGRYWPPDRVAELEDFTIQVTDTMPELAESAGQDFAIPPRLAQPARLSFRWLAAYEEIEEMDDHPAGNPICGWVMPNHLDDSLMIYAPEGDALGIIDEGGHWQTFPGNSTPVIPADIANPHLAQMVQWLCAQGREFLADFLSALSVAQENMEPESFAQHEAMALLMGQPLALVRAAVGLQLQEPAAINVSRIKVQEDVWAYYNYHAAGAQGPRPSRHSHAFEQVRAPLRLGEFHRLNDGLVGYWLEDGRGGYDGNTFYTPQTQPTPGLNEHIQTRRQANSEDRDESQFLIYLTLQDEKPRTITMLLDPRAPIHATTGILPVKDLHIPQDQYQSALQRMQVAFLTAPVLAPQLGMELSLPTEPGFEWRWVQRDGQQWSSISAEGVISKHQLQEVAGPATDPLWQALLAQGWLEALSDDTARMTPEDKRAPGDLPPPFTPAQEAVELLFHRLRLRPFDPMARFDTRYEIREGWLRLSPTNGL